MRHTASTKKFVPNVLLARTTKGTEHFALAAYLINIFKHINLIGLPYEDV